MVFNHQNSQNASSLYCYIFVLAHLKSQVGNILFTFSLHKYYFMYSIHNTEQPTHLASRRQLSAAHRSVRDGWASHLSPCRGRRSLHPHKALPLGTQR